MPPKKKEWKRPPQIGVTVLPAGPASAQEGSEGRKEGWTASGSWFIINGEIKIGRDRTERTRSPPSESPKLEFTEMCDLLPDDLECKDGEKFLGKGASGVVKLMYHKKTGKAYAVKVIHFGIILDKQMIEQEIRALEMASPFVVRAYTAFMRDRSLHIVQEYMDLGSLSDVLKKTKQIPEHIIRAIAIQVLLGLREMHEGLLEGPTLGVQGGAKHRIHRDLKPANLLVNSRGQVKIADFGIATTTNTVGKSTFVGTTTYMSPERIRGARYGTASDVWSVGLLLVESATGNFPFKDRSNFIELLIDITSTEKVALPDELSDTCKEFLWSCMAQNPEDRPSVSQLLKHPFITHTIGWSLESHRLFPRTSKKLFPYFLYGLKHRGLENDFVVKMILPFLSTNFDPTWVFSDWIQECNLSTKEVRSDLS
eukprot:NODE_1658_length_1859_cov_163.151498_g1405_i0.p1 GENE.NODE_1658_length_1859_cov_163.151498_g1405_i0~~NODE_1658_length_1859_cov_163.151498_g1405_i0.p1  ORF type:complete len:425 (+),score=63.69 NODE_1658_length_1859_cov_163.151498_g1405_i0:82-1356(+)